MQGYMGLHQVLYGSIVLLAWRFCGAAKIGRGYISDNFGSLGSTFSPTELPFQPSLMKAFSLPHLILFSAFCLLSFAGLFFSV